MLTIRTLRSTWVSSPVGSHTTCTEIVDTSTARRKSRLSQCLHISGVVPLSISGKLWLSTTCQWNVLICTAMCVRRVRPTHISKTFFKKDRCMWLKVYTPKKLDRTMPPRMQVKTFCRAAAELTSELLGNVANISGAHGLCDACYSLFDRAA